MEELILSTKNLDEVVDLIVNKVVDSLSKKEDNKFDNFDKYLTVEELSSMLNLAPSTIYTKVSKKEIPVIKTSKKLYFSKKEIEDFLNEQRKPTASQIEKEAEKYIDSKKKGGAK